MTTAHRPTWKAAVGKAQEGGWNSGGIGGSSNLSHLDLPAHTKLKFRTGNQKVDKQQALKDSLLKLEQAEKDAAKKVMQRPAVDEEVEKEGKLKLLKQTADVDDKAIKAKYDDDDPDEMSEDQWSDVDDSDNLDTSSDEEDSDMSDDDEEDDEAALMAELEKIKAEREAAKKQQEEEQAAEQAARDEESALIGNPLLNTGAGTGTAKLKRRWNEDVVFRNQAKGEPEVKKRFINDTVRNDFHRRFLDKFIR